MPKRPVLAPAFVVPEVDHNDHCQQNAALCQELSWIDTSISIGSWRDMQDEKRLLDLGVTHVLNVAKEVDPNGHCDTTSFVTKHIPLVDAYNEDLFPRLEEACEFIERSRQSGGKVLVHCRRGISRSPTIVVAHMMRFGGKSFDEAFLFVKEKRQCVSLNLSFREALSHYSPTTVNSSLRAEMDKEDERNAFDQFERKALCDGRTLSDPSSLASTADANGRSAAISFSPPKDDDEEGA